MNEKFPLTAIAIGLAMLLGGAALGTQFAHRGQAETATASRLLDLVSDLAARIDHIETSLQDVEQTARLDRSIQTRSAHHLELDAESEWRLTAIEEHLAELLSTDWAGLDPAPSSIDPDHKDGHDQPDPEPLSAVPMTHARESGCSTWGAQTAFEVENQYAVAPFFTRFGGQLSTDCRQTTCKLAWLMPSTESLAPDEAELMQSFAHYELAALAAIEGRGIGEFDVEWDASGPTPYVAVYLRQPEW